MVYGGVLRPPVPGSAIEAVVDLVILSIEPKEFAPIDPPEPSEDDPWSIRGQPVG
jgi:hypothetical protein